MHRTLTLICVLVLSLGMMESAQAHHSYKGYGKGYGYKGYGKSYGHKKYGYKKHGYGHKKYGHGYKRYGYGHKKYHGKFRAGGYKYGNGFRGYKGYHGGKYRRGYRGRYGFRRSSYNPLGYAIGGAIVGSVLTNAFNNNYHDHTQHQGGRVVSPSTPPRRLFKDRNGNCYQKEIDANGNEVLIELDPNACNWGSI